MDSHELKTLLESVRNGAVSPGRGRPEDPDVAPTRRRAGSPRSTCTGGMRCGFPGSDFRSGEDGRADRSGFSGSCSATSREGLSPRVDPATAVHPSRTFPQGEHNPMGRTFRLPRRTTQGAEARKSGRCHRRDERPPRRRGSEGDRRGLELRGQSDRRRGGRRPAPALDPASALGGADALVVVAWDGRALPKRRLRTRRIGVR